MNYADPDRVLNRETERPVLEATESIRADFELAVTRHHGYLMRIAVASTRNVADAEDVVQEALVRGFRALGKFRGDCPIRIWLGRIVVRVALNHRRNFVRNLSRWTPFAELGRERPEGGSEDFDAPAPGPGVPRETLMDVAKQVRRLPDEFRIPLLMFASDGMTIPEIAAVLEIPEGTVKSRIFYGRQRLRKGLRL